MTWYWDNGTWYLYLDIHVTPVQSSRSTSMLGELVLKPGISKACDIPQRNQRIMNGATTTMRTLGDVSIGDSNRFHKILLVNRRKARAYTENILKTANVAAMVLPLVLSLIPLALFMESVTTGSLIYALVTNVLNVLPLVFKGFELIYLVHHPPLSRFTLAIGLDSPSTFVAASTWVLKCQLPSNLKVVFHVFIIIAMTAAALGLFLEVRERKKLVSRRMTFKLKRLNDNHRMMFGVRCRSLYCSDMYVDFRRDSY